MTLLIKTIPLLPLSNNERERSHYMKLDREKNDWTLMIPMCPVEYEQGPYGKQRLVEIVFRKAKGPMSDDDNCAARCKVILDALRRRQWLHDDSPTYCKLIARDERGKTATIIAVSEVPAEQVAA